MAVGSQQMAASDQWIVRNDRHLPIGQVAAETLRIRLDAVWTELRSAGSAVVTVEHVHRLRVATRRTLAAFAAFRAVIPAKRREWFVKRLRRLRRAAGDARDLDVLAARLSHDDATPSRNQLLAMLAAQSLCARRPIRAQLARLDHAGWSRRVERLVAGIRARKRRASFPAFARRRLEPMVEAFFGRADRRLRRSADMHALRIEGKKLRYALEIFATVLPGRGLSRCEQALERLQKTLGRFTDHAAAADLLERWANSAAAWPDRDILIALGDGERRRAILARKAFSKWWNPSRRRSLRRCFERILRRHA